MSRTIPREAVDEFTRQLNLVSKSMRSKLAEQLAMIDLDAEGAQDAIQELMQLYCTAATDASALIASQYYDAAREYSIGSRMGASAVSQRLPQATTIAVNGILKNSKSLESMMTQLLTRLDYETKRAAGDCVFYNGSRDPTKPKYARVPSGSETCSFCLMLASRGFVYRTAKAAGDLDHYHGNCDCRVVPGWDGQEVEGYDTTKIYDQWQESMRTTAEERAARHDSSVDDEMSHMYSQLEEAAKRAKSRSKAVLSGKA